MTEEPFSRSATAIRESGRRDPLGGPSFGTPRPPTLESLRRFWPVVVFPALLLLVAGVTLGLTRAPTYTAETDLNVGRVDLGTQAVPGFVDGATTLADSYSRLVGSRIVSDPVARRLGQPPVDVADRLSATPVPDATVFSIEAEGGSERAAVQLANAAAAQLRRYVRRLGASDSRVQDLVISYRDEALELARLNRRRGRLQANEELGVGVVTDAEFEQASVDVAAAQLRVDTLAARYQEARTTDQSVAVRIISAARTAEDDRVSVAQRYAFVGLAGGLILGAALALLLAGRAWRRSFSLRS